MRRIITLAVLLFISIPFGISLAGCSKGTAVVFCNGQAAGQIVGQTVSLDLEPRLTGLSLNSGQISSVIRPSGKDCRGGATSVTNVVYGSTDITLADVVPNTGSICAGTWNRNTGGGIADFTTCTPATHSGTAFITATSNGIVSNPIPVYVHPIITSIVLGPASTDCANDPASNCAFDATTTNGCGTAPAPTAVPAYDGSVCLSQGTNTQLVARSYDGPVSPANNISCRVGSLTFSAQNPSVVAINENGLATATQPGATIITGAASQASSSAGFFATCPPASIVLTTPGLKTPPPGPVPTSQNLAQTLVATVVDTKGVTLNNIGLTYVSTSPTTIPASGSVITPTFPGAAAITALCQPPNCNSAPFNEIGLFGNGLPVTSNPVNLTASGTNFSTILYIGSTNSLYIQPVDFTQTAIAAPVRLPFAPNSMVLSQDLSTIYMGTATELMVYSASSNKLLREDKAVQGTVLAVSPDNSLVVITDPVRQLTYLYTAKGAVLGAYGGVGTHAQWSPDSTYVYVTTTDGRLLVHSAFTGWNAVPLGKTATDVAVTVPQSGVYLGGDSTAPAPGTVTANSNCPSTTVTGAGLNQQTSNIFYPQVDVTPALADRIAATNDGVHILGATPLAFTDIATNRKSGGCPVSFTSSTGTPQSLASLAATAITGLLPTSESAYAFVTYTGTGGTVPQYAPPTGTLSFIPLQSMAGVAAPTAPVAGVISADNNTLFVGTSGDNEVHRLTRGTTGFTDTLAPIAPALPGLNGGIATPNLLVQAPRHATS